LAGRLSELGSVWALVRFLYHVEPGDHGWYRICYLVGAEHRRACCGDPGDAPGPGVRSQHPDHFEVISLFSKPDGPKVPNCS